MSLRSRFVVFSQTLNACFIPPYKGAPVFFWLGFIFLSVVTRSQPLWKGDLPDSDDYMYLVQSIDWLNGQDWFDRLQHRMDPPQGVYIHFSHLLSALYACGIYLLKPFSDLITAVWLTAVIVPAIYFALFLLSMRQLTRYMVMPAWGDFSAYIVFFFPGLLFQFQLGHLDHHGLEALLALVSFYTVMRGIECPQAYKWPVLAGIVMALGLYIGLEILPVVGILSLGLGLWAMSTGGSAIRSGSLFGLTLFIASLVFLLIARAPHDLLKMDIDSYSIVYVILAGCIALCFASLELVREKFSLLTRYALGSGFACASGLIFLYFLPALKNGPYGDLDPVLANLIFDNASEAWPLIYHGTPLRDTVLWLIEPLLALGANLFMYSHEDKTRRRWAWGIHGFILLACLLLSIFYQRRFYSYVGAFSILPLTGMIAHDWLHTPDALSGKRYMRLVRLMVLFLAGPLIFTAMNQTDDAVINAEQNEYTIVPYQGCDMHGLAAILNDKSGLGGHPRLIINSIEQGPELLFKTPHSVLAGPFHTNVEGNMDALAFFSARDPDQAKAIAERRKADLIVICDHPSQLHPYSRAAADAKAAHASTFIQQLIHGQIPGWLKQIQSPLLGNFMLFEIQHP